MESTIWSIRGSRNESFGHARVRSVKSTHSRLDPFCFGTTIGFVVQVGCNTSLMARAFFNLLHLLDDEVMPILGLAVHLLLD